MRPLFGWHRNHRGYGYLIVLLAVAVCCLHGCAVSGGSKAPKDLNERNLVILVLARDSDPYSWREAERAFTPLTPLEVYSLRWALLR